LKREFLAASCPMTTMYPGPEKLRKSSNGPAPRRATSSSPLRQPRGLAEPFWRAEDQWFPRTFGR
jgi:hypothetical protein